MMEIKYKAWEPDTKMMMLGGTLDFWFQACLEVGTNPFRTRPNLIMLQYTGLKDKNGKEIYQGDILLDFKGDKRVVEYIDNGFWCSYPNGDHYFPATEHREIIGNIYENPELLK